MWRRISHALAWCTYGKSDVSLCAEMARRRAACRLCSYVCRALEFVPTFGPGHCDDELEFYMLKTPRKPGPLTDSDKRQIARWQKDWGIKEDGIPGHQFTGQLAIVLGDLMAEVVLLKTRNRALLVLVGVLAGTGGFVFGSM